ncbi:hypothetical protein NTCA1_03810 [Novosphingobium sp. TCA1]|nr:hypothetical protein NTCA1_03810 [Novosphingobium sp. TCA1]
MGIFNAATARVFVGCAIRIREWLAAPAHAPTRPPIQDTLLWEVGWGRGPVPPKSAKGGFSNNPTNIRAAFLKRRGMKMRYRQAAPATSNGKASIFGESWLWRAAIMQQAHRY